MKKFINYVKEFFSNFEVFLKYQIVSRILFSVILMPIFWMIVNILLKSKGINVISNNDMFRFLFSIQGFIFVILLLLIVFFGFIVEIYGFITVSSLAINKQNEVSFMNILKYNINRFMKVFDIGGIVLLFYIIFMIPLSGAGYSMSFLKNIKIPNFIITGIFENKLYTNIYIIVTIILFILSVCWIFSFHFMVIDNQKPIQALRNSFRLIRKNIKEFIFDFTFPMMLLVVFILMVLIAWYFLTYAIISFFNITKDSSRIILLALVYFKDAVVTFSSMLILPFELFIFTKMFYRYVSKTDEYKYILENRINIKPKNKKSLLDRIYIKRNIIIVVLGMIILIASIPSGLFFNELFMKEYRISVIGHRGGGGTSIPENSISSIKESIKNNVDYVEIDVQRTKDGEYIINHDSTFKRMAGIDYSSMEMSLEDIKKLDIGINYKGYEGEKVPTLKEVLELSKGKIGLYIELKGKTADMKMVDDVVKMVEQYQMKDHVVIVSLDYKLIKYVTDNYDIQSGFIYFLSIGNSGDFNANNVILEEDAATDDALTQIHANNKKAIVWTVNDYINMEKFVEKEIDGIITDEPKTLIEILDRVITQSESDRLYNMFVNND